jgi:hypothetical protein
MIKIKEQNRGFAALISVVLVSAALMAAVLQNTNTIAVLFDEANHKQYRLSATQSALWCLDTAVLEITHDYFFEVASSSPVSYPISHCSIVSVGETIGSVAGSGYVTVIVTGKSNNIMATIIVQVLLSDRKISLLSEKTFF